MIKKVKSLLQKIWFRILNPNFESQDLNHEDIIVHFAKVLKPKVYVELGLYECRLFNKLEAVVSEKLIGVDMADRAGTFMNKSDKAEFFCMSTDQFAERLAKENLIIDMLFIDANHSKESVKKDFENYFPYMRDNGIIFMHDGFPKNKELTDSGFCGDGYKAIFELSKHTENYEMVTIPLHPGLTICRKRTKQVPWSEN